MERLTKYLYLLVLVLLVVYFGLAVYDKIKQKLAPCPCQQLRAQATPTTQTALPTAPIAVPQTTDTGGIVSYLS